MAQLPKMKCLSRDLLLDILEALAEDMSDSKLCHDMSSISLSTSDSGWTLQECLDEEYLVEEVTQPDQYELEADRNILRKLNDHVFRERCSVLLRCGYMCFDYASWT